MGPEPEVWARPEVIDLGQQRSHVDPFETTSTHDRVDDIGRLCQVRRAGDVADHAADAYGFDRSSEQTELELSKLDDIVGSTAPA